MVDIVYWKGYSVHRNGTILSKKGTPMVPLKTTKEKAKLVLQEVLD